MRRKMFTENGVVVYRTDPGEYAPVGRGQITDLNTVMAAEEARVATEAAAAVVQAARNEELVATGNVASTTRELELNHISVIIAAAIAAPPGSGEIMTVKNTSASGIIAHTATLTGGTWDGTSTIATFDAPGEAIAVQFDANGDGIVLNNTGGVVFS